MATPNYEALTPKIRDSYLSDALDDSGDSLIDTITYDGFGVVTSESSTANGDRYKFAGREFDSDSRLQYNDARYYDPKPGRWLSEGPISLNAGDANLYRYTENNPTNTTDPTGLAGKVLETGTPVDPKKYGGGEVNVKDGPRGKLLVRENARIRRTVIRKGKKEEETIGGVLSIGYRGCLGSDVHFVQTFWKEGHYKKKVFNKTIVRYLNDRGYTEQPEIESKRVYHVDSVDPEVVPPIVEG